MAVALGKYSYAIRNKEIKINDVTFVDIIFLTSNFESFIVVRMSKDDFAKIKENFSWLVEASSQYDKNRFELKQTLVPSLIARSIKPSRKLLRRKETTKKIKLKKG